MESLEPTSDLHKSMLKAIAIVNPDDRQKGINKLGDMVSEDNVGASLDALLAQDAIDGSVSADDIVTMWEPLEGRYTVSQLLDEL